MTENKESEHKTKREEHMDFGGEILYRKYQVWEENTDRKNTAYIYEDDLDMKERMESIAWEERYKKKCQKMLDDKNEGK